MSDPQKLMQLAPRVLAALAETDLSLLEQAAVLRLAAEACNQAQGLVEIAAIIAKQRGKP